MSGNSKKEYLEALDDAFLGLLSGDSEQAIFHCERAKAIDLHGKEYLFLMGLIGFTMGEVGRAIEIFKDGHARYPEHKEFADALSVMYSRIGRLSDSLFYSKLALTLTSEDSLKKFMPDGFDDFEKNMAEVGVSVFFVNASVAFYNREYQKTVQLCESELLANPDNQKCQELMGRALSANLDYDRAIDILIKCVQDSPQAVENWLSLGDALLASGRPADATAIFESAQQHHPDSIDLGVRIALALAYQEDTVWTQCLDYVAKISTLLDKSSSENTSLAPKQKPQSEHKGPIHLGFLVNEATIFDKSEILAGLFAGLDDDDYKIFVYQQFIQPHPATTRLKDLAHHWRLTFDIDDVTFAKIIENDGIHHLIDMCGLMPGGRLPLLHAKPAPHQISWLGFPVDGSRETTDIVLSCDETLGVDERDSGGAKCISVGPTLFAYPGGSVVLGGDLKKRPAEQHGHITFGAFLDMPKLVDSIALWSEVLKAVEGSRLLLGGAKGQDLLWPLVLGVLEEYGLTDRVSIQQDGSDLSERAHFLLDVDIVLDTVTINGMGETCDALWMGVPVVSLCGDRRSSQIGRMLLNAADLSKWVADTPDKFVEIALGLALDLHQLGVLRKTLRDHIKKSTLLDTKAFVERIDKIFKKL